MAENRVGVHILANRSGRSYAETKQRLFEIMQNTPRAASCARQLAIDIGGEQHEAPRFVPSKPKPVEQRLGHVVRVRSARHEIGGGGGVYYWAERKGWGPFWRHIKHTTNKTHAGALGAALDQLKRLPGTTYHQV